MVFTNLTLVFGSDNRSVLGGYRCAKFWVYEISWDTGYDSSRSQRELPEYTKITPHCRSEKCVIIWGQKSCFFFAPKRYLSQGKPSKKNVCNTTRQGLSESASNDLI
jgi:hypothetical protein